MNANALIESGARSIASLAPALAGLENSSTELEGNSRAIERGHFTPAEEDRLGSWFARHLTARSALLETINEITPVLNSEDKDDDRTLLRGFIVGYTAACLLVRSARYLVSDFATDKLVQRKLNEAVPRFRIPRKQYTEIYRSLTSPANAWQLREAMKFVDEHRKEIEVLSDDPRLAGIIDYLHESEESVRISVSQYVKARLRYRWHSMRRRRASAVQQGFFAIAEAFGRVISEIHNPWHEKLLDENIQIQINELLEPGDVIVSRHHDALTNLALPGYWPHSSLYVGNAAHAQTLGVKIDADRKLRWVEPARVLEARKDGVLFRPLADTLAVDAVAIIRPKLSQAQIAEALTIAITHEGKLYNFDFDFFRADRLVCTEVVYRAYDGIGSIEFDLKQRAGRLTLSAEDLLDMALDDKGFEPVAVFGTDDLPDQLVVGSTCASALASSYRNA